MASLSWIRSEASKISTGSSDPAVKKLADLLAKLCQECEGIEKTAKEAEDEARRAKRDARK
jgi:outer membrane murein-binding lipoprotein Lpp